MERKTYREKLLDPRWQKRRLETLDRFEFRCANCGSKEKTLHVHHLYYVSGRNPWDYPDQALRCLCEDCHEEWHQMRARLNESLSRVWDQELVIGYVEGALSARLSDDEGDVWFHVMGDSWIRGFVSGFNDMFGEELQIVYDDVYMAIDETTNRVEAIAPWKYAKAERGKRAG